MTTLASSPQVVLTAWVVAGLVAHDPGLVKLALGVEEAFVQCVKDVDAFLAEWQLLEFIPTVLTDAIPGKSQHTQTHRHACCVSLSRSPKCTCMVAGAKGVLELMARPASGSTNQPAIVAAAGLDEQGGAPASGPVQQSGAAGPSTHRPPPQLQAIPSSSLVECAKCAQPHQPDVQCCLCAGFMHAFCAVTADGQAFPEPSDDQQPDAYCPKCFAPGTVDALTQPPASWQDPRAPLPNTAPGEVAHTRAVSCCDGL